ncbi:kinase-like domain-containing protein [Cladochytrium replicatum]|nr:kinase-like domain-containing protein [Cladochytrium replicatum]
MPPPKSSSNSNLLLNTVIMNRYKLRKEIGRGAYGVVWAATDIKTGQEVAVKRVGSRNFEETILAKRALRELKLLRHLNGNDNIAAFLDVDVNDTRPKAFQEIYLVEGLMEADLNQIIKSGQALTEQHFQYFIYQILRGLKWMHTANIIHRDLKPGNLLVNSDCELRICDFGLARGANDAATANLNTEYVATRYYRAPEVVLSPKHYSKAIDVWSVGCIFAELMGGRVMFKGSDYIDQLQKIFQVLGTPSDPTLTALCSQRVLRFLQSWPVHSKVPWTKLFPRVEASALDLLERLLAFDPSKRLTAEQSLRHKYLSAYHHPEDEPDHPTTFDFGFESAQTIDNIKVLILREVADFRAEGSKRHAGQGGPTSPTTGLPSITPSLSQKDGSSLAERTKQFPRYAVGDGTEEALPAGAANLEEELQMRELRISE